MQLVVKNGIYKKLLEHEQEWDGAVDRIVNDLPSTVVELHTVPMPTRTTLAVSNTARFL